MRRPLAYAAVLVTGLLATAPTAALAHQGNPNMKSVVTVLRPVPTLVAAGPGPVGDAVVRLADVLG